MASVVKSCHTKIMKGKYIVIEGHEGTGKTSQVQLLRERLAKEGIESVEMIEPGSVAIAESLRATIKNATLERDALTNLLLFTAARRETWRQLAGPAMKEGKWVIAGRNWYSTLAIQGFAEGLDQEIIEATTRQFVGENYMQPHQVFILLMNDETERHRRLKKRGEPTIPDTFESRDKSFQDRVRKGYEQIVDSYNAVPVNAAQSLEVVADTIWQHISFPRG
jgi:dTMP kinase